MKNLNIFIILVCLLLSISLKSQEEGHYGPDIAVVGFADRTNPIPLQKVIDQAPPGKYVKLEPGYYTGPAVIKKDAITLDGGGQVTISGLGKESIIYIEANTVKLTGLHLVESGGSHDKIDCGVKITGNYNVVENCIIEECLFGIDIFQADNNRISKNEITSLSRRGMALKGDAIRLWYSKNNLIKGNYWYDVRDMVVWYSSENTFEANKGVGNRYSIHFMYAHNNRIKDNYFYENSVGVFLMYSEETVMTGNTIMHSNGISGMCLGMKETSSNQILHNRFIYSAEGIHVDVSPFVPEKINTVMYNEIAFCGTGIKFHTNQEGNLYKFNYFHNNLVQVEAEGKTANMNRWQNNYFDDYQGFDKDGDNEGDTPYTLFAYVEHLWTFDRDLKFFYGSPLLLVLDFLERLAPFSEPKLVLRDKTPIFQWNEELDEKLNEKL
ncbi:MAG: nitrous oxide reductase family maturation protein NosD [Bacteroidetes bacterium]|nr:nitrous oxide reductase family maturation protein NosD [Bacteroidota bacterium]MBU1581083.1 nitrous oxide reductase family maturation protein NosD [Bacteroidota bacterium]MBU2558880.1 nitrous oxide reductase family maturation protein NosD [Bacteroidota bacterium]